jgi:hypothetical protein
MKSFIRVWLGIGFVAIGLGICLLIIAFISGARWENTWEESSGNHAAFITMKENYEGVEKLDMDVDYGEVEFVKGNEFSISAENILEGELKSYVENGTWYLREDESKTSNYFGINFPMRKLFFSWGDHFAPKITVTLPDEFVADKLSLKIGAGTLKAEELKATEGEFKVGAGQMNIEKLSVSESSKYTVGTGEMVLQEVNVNNITVDSGVGHVQIEGTVNGDNNIKCGIGGVDLTLNGTIEEYEYDITCGIGHVDIDGRSYRNISEEVINNDSADNKLNLNCGIGQISVDFN